MGNRIFRMAMVLAVLVLAFTQGTEAQIQWKIVKDTRAAKIVGENTGSATVAEDLNKQMFDSIKQDRASLLAMTTLRNIVMQAREAQQNYLGNMGREKQVYSSLLKKCERLLNSASRLVQEGMKHPERALFVGQMAAGMVANVSADVTKLMKISLRSDKKNPLEDEKEKKKKKEGEEEEEEDNDGANLLYYNERQAWLNRVLYEIDKVSYAMDTYTFMLQTRYTWKDYVSLADKQTAWNISMIESKTSEIKNTIKGRPLY